MNPKTSSRIFQVIILFVLFLCCPEALADTQELIDADSLEARTWRDKTNKDVLPIKLPNQQLVHKVEMNGTPAKSVLTEICRRGGICVIFDRSVEGKTVTGKFSDVTLNEMLSSVLLSTGLRARPLTDNLLLIEIIDAEKVVYAGSPEYDLPETSQPVCAFCNSSQDVIVLGRGLPSREILSEMKYNNKSLADYGLSGSCLHEAFYCKRCKKRVNETSTPAITMSQANYQNRDIPPPPPMMPSILVPHTLPGYSQ